MSSKPCFDDIAQQWDSMRQSFFSDNVRSKALAVSGARAGQSAADIGAGSGFITEGLIANGLQVIAVDQSSAMLETMQAKFTGQKGIDYHAGVAEHLPIADQAVDYVFANMCLHHVKTLAQATVDCVGENCYAQSSCGCQQAQVSIFVASGIK
jgi:ubiquinone/menaquinone biosynthesis C-methylase UbiE